MLQFFFFIVSNDGFSFYFSTFLLRKIFIPHYWGFKIAENTIKKKTEERAKDVKEKILEKQKRYEKKEIIYLNKIKK